MFRQTVIDDPNIFSRYKIEEIQQLQCIFKPIFVRDVTNITGTITVLQYYSIDCYDILP